MDDAKKMMAEALDRLVVDNMETAAELVLRILSKCGVNGFVVIAMPAESVEDGVQVVMRSTMEPCATREVCEDLLAGMKAEQADAPQA